MYLPTDGYDSVFSMHLHTGVRKHGIVSIVMDKYELNCNALPCCALEHQVGKLGTYF